MTTHLATTLAVSLLDSLFGVQRISILDDRSEIGWRYDVPGWAWMLIILAAALLAGWSYHHLLGARLARIGLAGVRALIVVFIAALLAGPMLVLPQEQVEPDWLLVLVDRSASMAIRDAPARPDGVDTISRDESLRRALAGQEPLFSPEKLGKDRRVLWLGFDAGTYTIDAPLGAAAAALPAPQGRVTSLRQAVEQALQRAAGRPVSGVVLMTDGRSPQETGADLVRRLSQQAVPVFSVPLGSPTPGLDLAVGRVDAPDKALVNDIVPVSVWVERFPRGAAVDASRLSVRLIDTLTGDVLDEKPAGDDPSQPVRLTGRSKVEGDAPWRVQVVYELVGTRGELIADNNDRMFTVTFIDRPVRVLYVEGYPRWEYRYLKNMLLREKSIASSTMLISADRAFAQEGDVPIARLPQDAKEFEPYDVIILGDVPAEYFSGTQLTLIRDHVANRGTGLLWIGGHTSMPGSYDGTPLADLLPMRNPAAVGRLDTATGAIAMQPTPLSEALQVLRLLDPHRPANEQPRMWPDTLAPLVWAQDLGRLKPTAEVLAVAPQAPSAEAPPLVARMRFGAGQSLYVGTDETWRWRLGRGDVFFDQFWTQLVQMLGRSRLQQGDKRLWLDVSQRRAAVGQAVVVELTIRDELILRRELPTIALSVSHSDDEQSAAVDTVELLPESTGLAGGASTLGAGMARYRGIWRPSRSGLLTLRVTEPAVADLSVTQQVEIVEPNDEMLDPSADHVRLATLAEATGGKVVPVDQLEELATLVPNRARRTPNDIRESLWDSPLALLLALLLFTSEWIGRKIVRLV